MKKYRMYFMNINSGKEFYIEVNNSDEILTELNKKPQYLEKPDNWECFDQEEIEDPNIPKYKIMVAILDYDFEGDYPEVYNSSYAHESYTFDTPEEFIEKWYELDEGAWYWVYDKGEIICSGAVDPNDIEIFEDYFNMSFEEEC